MVILLGLLICGFHLASALSGRSLIRASHLGVALNYAKTSIDLFHPIIPGFNANESPTALEFPVWQAFAGLAFKLTQSTWYGWANLVSLLLFATGVWPFFAIVRQYAGERVAWWSLVFFLAQPLVIVMAGEASTDGFCLVATLWFLFFADTMIRSGSLGLWLPTALFAALSAVSKLPFFMAAGLCSVAMLVVNGIYRWRPWVLLASSGAIAAVVFGFWSHYTDSLAAQAEFPFTELRLSHSSWLFQWYFGDLHSRLSPFPWIRGARRFLYATMGSLPLVALLLCAVVHPGNRLARFWIAGAFLTTLVFTNLVLAHWHYYLMCCPAVALLCGATVTRWESRWGHEIRSARFGLAMVAIMLVFSSVEGITAMRVSLDCDPFNEQISEVIRKHTKPEDKLVVYNYHLIWGGEVLFRSNRKGLVVSCLEGSPVTPSPKGLRDLLGNPTDLQRLKSLGYTKLVLISESPLQFAVMAINGKKQSRGLYPTSILPEVDAWPAVYQSEDVVIKEIK